MADFAFDDGHVDWDRIGVVMSLPSRCPTPASKPAANQGISVLGPNQFRP